MRHALRVSAFVTLLAACAEKTLPDDPVVAVRVPQAVRADTAQAVVDRSLDLPDAVTASCAQVANVVDRVARAAGLDARSAIGPDTLLPLWFDRTATAPAPGCVVRLADSSGTASLHPQVALALAESGWQDRSRSIGSDSHDGTQFGFSRDGALCIFSAGWDGGDDADTAYAPVPGFMIEAVCIADRPDPAGELAPR